MSLNKPFTILMKQYGIAGKFLKWVEKSFANGEDMCTFYEKNTKKTTRKKKRGSKKNNRNNKGR